jgi:outer membrane protein
MQVPEAARLAWGLHLEGVDRVGCQLVARTSNQKPTTRNQERAMTMLCNHLKHDLWTLTWASLLLALVAGCAGHGGPSDAASQSLKAKVSQIDMVRLEDRSTAKPVTTEQARAVIAQEINEPNRVVEAVKLTLEEVRASALANNLDLRVELMDPAIAQRTLDAEKAKFEAVFAGRASYRGSRDEEGRSGTSSYEMGLSQPLPTGGSIEVGVPLSDSDSESSAGVAEAAVSVSVIHSLLRGAGLPANLYSIRVATHEKGIVDAQTKQRAIQVLADADTAYWWMYATRKELEVRREQYKLAQDQLDHARRKVASRSAPKIEIVRADAGLASRLEAVINAETAVQSAERELRRIMNRPDLPLNSKRGIIPVTEPGPLGLQLDPDRLADEAVANRMETIQMELTLAIDKLNVDLAQNRLLPDLTVDYTYSTGGQAGSLGRAFGRVTSGSADDHSVGLAATIPLGNAAAKARLARARLQELRDKADRDRLTRAIRQEVYEAVSELDKDWRRILAADQGVTAAMRDYRVEQGQFRLGVRTSTDVLYSATGLADAQLRRIYAFTGYQIAQVNLARATGTLLGYGQIHLDDLASPSPIASSGAVQ